MDLKSFAKGRGRLAGEFGLLLAAGLLFGAIAPFRTDSIPGALRYLYWVVCIGGGGLIGLAVDAGVRRFVDRDWTRVALASVLMTPFVTAWVMATARAVAGQPLHPDLYLGLQWQVVIVCLPIFAVREVLWRRPALQVETRVVTAPALPHADAAFRRRLSARRRFARLIAVEAEDHYLRVHTDAGAELVTLRFSDAMAELGGVHGLRIHRSWWVAGDAIAEVRWRRGGGGEVSLPGGLAAPVSRSYAPALKAAGWT